MPLVPARRKQSLVNFSVIGLAILTIVLVLSGKAVAQPDNFFNGDGHDAATVVGSTGATGALVPNTVAGATGAVTAGSTTASFVNKRLGTSNGTVTASAVADFAVGRLVMVYQAGISSGGPTSGDQSPFALSNTTAGHWEFARIQSIAGSTLTFTNPLIYTYVAANTQLIAVPEYPSLGIRNAGSTITAPAWDGSSGGVLAVLVSGATTFFQAGSISASASGFRGGLSHAESSSTDLGCTSLDGSGPTDTQGIKGEGYYSPAFIGSTAPTAGIQIGRGNYGNGGGGGDCFNASGGGGGNGGLGGKGGRSLTTYDSGRDVGGLGGRATTGTTYAQMTMGGGGGAGERNNNGVGNGGTGGGIVFMRGGSMVGSGVFAANGSAGTNGSKLVNGTTNTTPPDGSGGGGAGGTIVLRFAGAAACGSVSANGGAGGDNQSNGGNDWSPGGGGGGGKTYIQGSSGTCTTITPTASGGAAGSNTSQSNAYGALAGAAGTVTKSVTATSMPTVAVSAPTSGTTINTATPAISGTSTSGANVHVWVDGVFSGTTTAVGTAWSYTIPSALSQGSHTILAYSEVGLLYSTSGTTTFTVDTVGPAAPTLASNRTGTVNQTTATITYTAAEGGGTMQCSLDGAAYTTCTASPIALSGLADGAHTYAARQVDAVGNNGSVSTVGWTVDTIAPPAPTVTRTSPSSTPTSQTTATITFSANEAGGTLQCSVDGGSFGACPASPASLSSLTDGTHSYAVHQTDAGGNVSAPASVSWVVDTTPPVAPTITGGPNAPVASTTAAFTFTGEVGGTFQCYIDSPVNWVNCTSGVSYPSLAQGAHTFHVRQTDGVGNVGPESTRAWSVDTVGPPAPSVSGPSGTTGSTSASITFSDTESPVTFKCSLDGALASTCTSPQSLSGLSNTTHSYAVYAVDPLGNAGSATTISWTVDSSLFTVGITAGPSGTVATANNAFSFVATLTSGTTYQCKIETTSFAPCTSPFSTGALADGSHTFSVYAVNGAQTTPTVTRTYTVDTTGPTVTITSPASNGLTTGPNGSVTFTATDASGTPTTTCQLDGGAIAACTSPLAYGSLSDGSHTVTVTATDLVGNTNSAVRTWTVDATPPDTSILTKPAAVTNSTTANFTFSATQAGSTFECVLDGSPIASCVTPLQYTGLGAGSHSFSVRATDQYGNVDQTAASWAWSIDTTAPAAPLITTPAADISTNDTTPAISGTAEVNSTVKVYDGATLIATVTANGSGVWALSPDPTLSEGAHAITATSTDAASNVSPVSATRNITIDTAAPSAPSITTPSGNITSNNPVQPISGTAEANSTVTIYDGATLIGTATTNGSGNWSLSPTPTFSEAVHPITAWATDAAGNTSPASQGRTITIDTTAPTQPSITSPATGLTTSDNTPHVVGTAEANSTVKLYADGVLVCTTTADGSGDWNCNASSLSDGDYTLTATATDSATNTSSDSDGVAIIVDTTNPSVNISAPANGSTVTTTTPSITFTATDANLQAVECSIDGDPYVACSSPQTTPPLGDGPHTFSVRATDDAGNTATATINFNVDATAPVTQITDTPPSNSSDNTPTFEFDSDDPTATFECKIDAGSYAACVSPFTSAALIDGSHTFSVRATDTHGNVDQTPATYTWTVDTTAPDAPEITTPASDVSTNVTNPPISGTAEANSTVKVYDGATLIDTVTADGNGDWSLSPNPTLSEGAHPITATSTDAAGNTSPASSTRTITIDTNAPDAPEITTPSSDITSNSSVQAISGTAEADSTVTVYDGATLIGTTTADGSGNWSLSPDPTFADGDHPITAWATDAAGNISPASDTRVITIDTADPAKPTITSPNDGDATSDDTPHVVGTAEADSTVKVFDGATLVCTTTANAGGNWSCDTDSLGDGTHTLSATATDAAGNEGPASDDVDVIVDTTDPSVNISSPADSSTVNTPTPAVVFTATDDNLDVVECSIDGAAYVACSSPQTTPPLDDGPHTFSVRATDDAGNSSTATISFDVDATAPVSQITDTPDAIDPSDTATFEFNADDPTATFECSIDGDPFVACTSPFTTPSLDDGPHTFQVRAVDPHGNTESPAQSFSWTVDTTAPNAPAITTPASDVTTNVTTPPVSGTAEANATVKVYDDGTLIATVTADGNGDWSLSPNPTLSEGSHPLTATATDAAGNTSDDSSTRTITVDTSTPDAPEITTPSGDITSNNPVQPISGTAEANSTVTVYDGATLIDTTTADGSGDWSLSPDHTFSEGDHVITAWATDAAGNTSAASTQRVITIDTTNPAKPVITSPTDGDATSDDTPTVTGTAEPGSTVKVYDGATLVCATNADVSGDWDCDVTTLSTGTHTLTAVATDDADNDSPASDAVDLTIDQDDPVVNISSPSSGVTLTTHTPTITFTATDDNLVKVECKVDGGAFANCTSPFTTASLTDGSHTVSVRATDAADNAATASVTFTIDTTAPTTSITGKPSSTDTDTTPTFTFTSNDGSATFECEIDGGGFAACTSPFTSTPLTDGPHTFKVRATDTHGNPESPAQSYSWTIDTTAPAKPVVTTPAASALLKDDTPTISGDAEAGADVEVFVDGNSIGHATANGSGHWTINSTHLADGSHSATAQAKDSVGNTSVLSDPVSFTIDTTPPGGTIEQAPGTVPTGENPTFTITPNEGDSTITCSLDGAPSAPCSSPYTPSGKLAPGTHTVVVTFTDPAGNTHQETITFVIAAEILPPDPTQCLGGGVVITDLFPKGGKATISGFARKDLVGKPVTITYNATKKTVATALVKSDGSFTTTFKAPPKKDWNKNTTTYLASAGEFKSKKTKLLRRTSSTVGSYSGGKLTVSGTVTLPLVKGGGATIKAKTGCTGTWKVIGTTKFKKNGAFSFTTPYVGSGVIFVQVNAVIGNPSKKNKKFKTNSFVVPVIVK